VHGTSTANKGFRYVSRIEKRSFETRAGSRNGRNPDRREILFSPDRLRQIDPRIIAKTTTWDNTCDLRGFAIFVARKYRRVDDALLLAIIAKSCEENIASASGVSSRGKADLSIAYLACPKVR